MKKVRIISHHKAAQRDINHAVAHYQREGGYVLALRFLRHLEMMLAKAAAHPGRFSKRVGKFRRANLIDFPYHFLFASDDTKLEVVLVRYNGRHPAYGLHRRSSL